MKPPTYQRFCTPCNVFHMSFDTNYYAARKWVDEMWESHNPAENAVPTPADDDTQEVERHA